MSIKFGPSGIGPVATAEKVLEQYNKLGLKVCEIAFTYSVYIKNKSDALRIGKKAKSLGIELTIHAPYFVNLNSEEKEKIEATKKRILSCCEIGEILGATKVVFHPGYYGKNKEQAKDKIIEGISDIMQTLKEKNWKIKLAPETMGKVNVFGSPEEIHDLVKATGCSFCIDFAHILAREKSIDFKKIISLFPQKDWHVHFSGIVYGEKGEKHHRDTKPEEWENILKNLPKDKDITIVCEAPNPSKDAKEGLEIYKKLIYN